MSSTARFERLAVLHLAAAMLLLLAAPAQAQSAGARLSVTAETVIVCQLEASVPKVGTSQRKSGGASLSAKCSRGASASAAACPTACDVPRAADGARSEQRVAKPAADGTTVATLLF